MEQHAERMVGKSLPLRKNIYVKIVDRKMSHVKSYDDFLNEAIHVVKRKYTESHPQKVVSDYAPVRERVLSFVTEKGRVTVEEMQEFLKLMNEETGRKASMGWVNANSNLFRIKEENGVKYYRLSTEGKRIHAKMTENK